MVNALKINLSINSCLRIIGEHENNNIIHIYFMYTAIIYLMLICPKSFLPV